MTISREKLIHNFNKRIKSSNKTECWPWLGVKDRKGYGQIKWGGKRTGAHRMAYRLSGKRLEDGLVVAHKCDNPSCCNPRHLFQTTQAGNLEDMRRKKRGHTFKTLRGEAHGRSKLSDAKCNQIRKLYSNHSQTELAAKFGIAQSHVSRIIRGENRS